MMSRVREEASGRIDSMAPRSAVCSAGSSAFASIIAIRFARRPIVLTDRRIVRAALLHDGGSKGAAAREDAVSGEFVLVTEGQLYANAADRSHNSCCRCFR